MRGPKIEKVTGVVALSYLVLIPVGGFIVWQKVKELDKDIDTLWLKKDETVPRSSFAEGVREHLGAIFAPKQTAPAKDTYYAPGE